MTTNRASMAPNEQARKNHDELLPDHVSTLAVTDPELIEVFDILLIASCGCWLPATRPEWLPESLTALI